MPSRRWVVGVDFGTLSARAVVVDADDGRVLGSGTSDYEHGVLDQRLPVGDIPLGPGWALQVPRDYVGALGAAVRGAIEQAKARPDDVVGVATDFTACTVLPVLDDGTPLCELEEFRARPHAYVKLWKHHAAQPQADRINALATARGESWLARYGGRLSSEWELAKGLELFEHDREIYDRMDHWVEASDWIVWQMTGEYVRGACATGYEATYQDGAFPDPVYLAGLAPGFGSFIADKVEREIVPTGHLVGGLTDKAAQLLGLRPGTPVATGNVDSLVTPPALGVIHPQQMLIVMGTSNCHIMSGERLAEIPGMSGVVDGGVVPGMYGYAAGQSGVGDIFAWFVEHAAPQEVVADAQRRGVSVHAHLSELAAELRPGESGLLALDWHAGNRSVLVDHELSGLIVGLTLTTRPAEVYRALIEATAFGTRRILDQFTDHGVPVDELVVAGGLVQNDLVLGIYADVTGRPLWVSDTEHAPALGAALQAAVAAGVHEDIRRAADAMAHRPTRRIEPDPDRAATYTTLYAEYLAVHDHFGGQGRGTMHRLQELRRKVTSS